MKVNYFGAFETLGWLSFFILVRPAFVLVNVFCIIVLDTVYRIHPEDLDDPSPYKTDINLYPRSNPDLVASRHRHCSVGQPPNQNVASLY